MSFGVLLFSFPSGFPLVLKSEIIIVCCGRSSSLKIHSGIIRICDRNDTAIAILHMQLQPVG